MTPDRSDRLTDGARRVLVFAQEEARRLNHNYIGTEHLLLGLVREQEGIAAGVLHSLGSSLGGYAAASSSSSAAVTELSTETWA